MPRKEVRLVDAHERARIFPVVTTEDVSLPSDIEAGEAKMVAGEPAVAFEQVAEAASNSMVVSDTAPGNSPQISLEVTQAAVELRECNYLGFHVANVLNNYSLAQLAENSETLLDNLDLSLVADEFPVFDNDLVEVTSIEVVDTVEAVEVVKRFMISPAVEGDMRRPGGNITAAGKVLGIRLGADGGCKRADGKQ